MKKFLIVGSKGAITYKDFFPYLKDRKVYMHIVNMTYENGCGVPSAWYSSIGAVKKEPLVLTKTYNEEDYKKYDNYDAIEVSKVKDIPYDYDGVMGVPITFLDKWDGSDFEVIASTDRGDVPYKTKLYEDNDLNRGGVIIKDGKMIPTYARILIKKKT